MLVVSNKDTGTEHGTRTSSSAMSVGSGATSDGGEGKAIMGEQRVVEGRNGACHFDGDDRFCIGWWRLTADSVLNHGAC